MAHKKRVLEFLTYGGIGGTQQMFLEFMRHVSHEKYTFYVCVLLGYDFVNSELDKMHVENINLNMQSYWDLAAWWKLYAFIKTKKIDLIRTYGLKAHLFGRFTGKVLKVPVNITSVRSTDPWRKWYHSQLDVLTSGLTDLYLSNSEAGRDTTHSRERIPLKKIMTIPNGIALDRCPDLFSQRSEISTTFRTQFELSSSVRIIGTVATFRQMKGHSTIIHALPRIQERFPDVKWLFVGGQFVNEPFYEEELKRSVRKKGLEHVVIFTGFRRDVLELLACCELFVLPSWWEGLSRAILEAMALRKPVIASAVGGNLELVQHGETGMLIPPKAPDVLADTVSFLLENPDLAARMGSAGYARVRDCYSLEKNVNATELVYDRLIAEKTS